jgi:asparagine synthetase B (glutamine-hydrolysing)
MKNLCKSARNKGYKILLGGDGVDEYFSGYNTFNISLNNNTPYGLHKILTLKDKFNITNREKENFYRDIIISKKKLIKKFNFIKNKKEKKILVNNFLDTEFFLQTCTLPHSDEYSMHESIEMRNVYLELDLVRFCINLHPKFKISRLNKFKNKYLFRELAIRKYGSFINKEKEGTRNYSKFISNYRFWNFNAFLISKFIKIDKKNSYKDVFKLLNLEIVQRSILSDNSKKFLREILTPFGRKSLLI